MERRTLGDYLSKDEPVAALWVDMVKIVHRDSPNDALIERLGPASQSLFYVGCFQGELVNGGVSQFFSNSAGNCALETLVALREMGAKVCVEILEQALVVFPEARPPKDRQQRCELLFAFEAGDPELLEQLSRIYYKRVEAMDSSPEEDLTALQLAFIRAHAAELVEA